MANVNAPFGALLADSEGKEFRVRRYPKKSGNVISPGDFVIRDATGSVDLATANSTLLGVAAEYKAATDTTDIAVIDDPEAVFRIQASADAQATNVFNNADFVATAYDSLLKKSKMALDSSTFDTTDTLPLVVIGLDKSSGNAYGSYARLLVKINKHAFKAIVAGV